jgi:hypothetical protein
MFVWANQISRRSDRPPQANLAQRFVMIGVALVLTQVSGDTAKLTFRHGSAIPRDLNTARSLRYDLSTHAAQISALTSIHAIATSHAYGTAHSRLRQITRDLIAHELVTDECTDRLDQLTDGLIEGETSSPTGGKLREHTINFFQRLVVALDIPRDAYALSMDDMGQWTLFLNCAQRILECRNAAEWVTQAGWDQVCDQLIV